MAFGANDQNRLPLGPTLEKDQVHIWSARLDNPSDNVREPASLLSQEERGRASRFVFEPDRARYIQSHAILRILLGHYLEIEPSAVRFSYGQFGQPSLLNVERNASGLSFNMSHSHQAAVYAFVRGRPIGVDVEFMAPKSDLLRIAEQFFSRNEYKALIELFPSEQTQGFYNCWTRKEAFVKALGTGLMLPLDQFDVSLKLGEPAQLLCVKGDSQAVGDWSLKGVTPCPGYNAAMAVRGQNMQVLQFSASGSA
jgi:4'-phosphopantetheinyl transferase